MYGIPFGFLFQIYILAFSVLPVFFGMRYLRRSASYGEVAVIALVVYIALTVFTVVFPALGIVMVLGSPAGGKMSMISSMIMNAVINPLIIFGLICSYLKVFGILASTYFVFIQAEGEIQ
jgi:hypothetical protein